MVIELITLGMIYGMLHALEPDHMIAVATMMRKSRNIIKSSLLGILWGFGHSIVLLIIGIAILFLSFDLNKLMAVNFEILIGMMLVGLGLIRFIRNKHSHPHSHGRFVHSHEHKHNSGHSHRHLPIFVGMVHGLGGSGLIVVGVLASTLEPTVAIAYLAVFGIANMITMGLSTIGIGVGLSVKLLSNHLPKIFAAISILSISLGSYIILKSFVA